MLLNSLTEEKNMYKYNSIVSDSKGWFFDYEEDLQLLLENIKEKRDSQLSLTEEEQRILIFRDALIQQKGEEWVSAELKKNKLRAIYTRNPIELVIYYCLKANDTELAYKKYDLKEFIKLVKSLPSIEPSGVDLTTFGQLHEYVDSYKNIREISDEERHSIPARTQGIKKRVEIIDKTLPTSEEQFVEIFHEHSIHLRDTSESIRYYVSKYIYYVICAQILEFKEILTSFSKATPQKALQDIYNDKELYSRFTLVNKIACDKNVESSVENDENQSLQISKVLLSLLTKNFPLYGSAQSTADSVSSLFVHAQKAISIAQLKDETAIFESSSNFADNDLHLEKAIAIQSLKLSDFYGFKIDYNQLYSILFETLSGGPKSEYASLYEYDKAVEEEKIERKIQSRFLRSVVAGTMDVSRSALLMLLASAKSVIESTNLLGDNYYSVMPVEDRLDLDRINYILNRVGYIKIQSDDESSFDFIYYVFFDNCVEYEDNISYIDDLIVATSDFIAKYGQSAMPFEITEISSRAAHKSIMKG